MSSRRHLPVALRAAGDGDQPARLLEEALTVAERARVTIAWKRTWRGAPIEVDSGFSRDLIPALKQGRLDFALVGLPGEVSGLETRAVSTSPLAAALPSRHRLARRKRVSLLEVTDLPLFWIPRTHNPAYHDFCTDYFRRIGYRPQLVVVEPGQLQTLERIAAGEGWTIPNGATLATRVRGVAYRPKDQAELREIPLVGSILSLIECNFSWMSRKITESYKKKLAAEDGYIITNVAELRIALCYPNTHSIGMANLGLHTMYELFNSIPGVSCERVFLPDTEELREYEKSGTPLLSLETQRRVRDFDVVAFSISFETDYLNMARMLQLSGIPVWSKGQNAFRPASDNGRCRLVSQSRADR